MRHLVLGHLLQSFVTDNDQRREEQLLRAKHRLSRAFGVPVAPTPAAENTNMLRALGSFAVGRKSLSVDVIDVLRQTFNDSELGAMMSLEDDVGTPIGMRRVLERVGYFKPNDNPHRVIASHRIEFAPSVHALVPNHLVSTDPFDRIRRRTQHGVYAIDSATTSEVDDAIGIEVDTNGVEWITVYVSDATVHCPFDSELEQLSA